MMMMIIEEDQTTIINMTIMEEGTFHHSMISQNMHGYL